MGLSKDFRSVAPPCSRCRCECGFPDSFALRDLDKTSGS